MKPKKPKKKDELKNLKIDNPIRKYYEGYNQGLSDMEAYHESTELSKKEIINTMTEYWDTRDMIHGSRISPKFKERIIKLLAQAIIDAQKEK